MEEGGDEVWVYVEEEVGKGKGELVAQDLYSAKFGRRRT